MFKRSVMREVSEAALLGAVRRHRLMVNMGGWGLRMRRAGVTRLTA
ncbi:hypothetical protein [Paracoccus broussonetiae]|nr:hypothetical protein [Paracoccus sp. CPCC 101403]